MEDSTKAGIATGVAMAIAGAFASYICFKEGHALGRNSGLAEGLELGSQKYDELNDRFNALSREVDELKRFKEKLEQQNGYAVASAEEIYRLCRDEKIIDEETYSKLIASLGRGDVEAVASFIDDAIESKQEASKVLRGEPGVGRIESCSLGQDSDWDWRWRFRGCHSVAVRFSEEVRGRFIVPSSKRLGALDGYVILADRSLQKRMKEIVPGWKISEVTIPEVRPDKFASIIFLKRQLSLMNSVPIASSISHFAEMIVKQALDKVDGKKFLCESVEFPTMEGTVDWSDFFGNRIHETKDYQKGQVESAGLTNYLRGELDSVSAMLETFSSVQTEQNRNQVLERRNCIENVAKGQPVQGVIDFMEGKPCVRLCEGLYVPLEMPDGYLYFEGDGLSIRTNCDLHSLLKEILPEWVDKPISDARMSAVLNGYSRRYGPAEGAVRELLRFQDAAKQVAYACIRQKVGALITCESVVLHFVDGSVSMSSYAQSSEVDELVKNGVFEAQKRLRDFAESRSAELYSHEDLVPDRTTSGYYRKWKQIENALSVPQVHVGDIVTGVVRKIVEYGAFVDFPGGSGLLHISEISNRYLLKDKVREYVRERQRITVKVISVDLKTKKIGLSLKRLHSGESTLS